MKILSFDVGGTKIAHALINEYGEIVSDVTIVPTLKTPEDIEKIFIDAAKSENFDAAAIATAGVVYNGKIQGKPNNLPEGYQHIDFTKIFSRPCLIENDANSALWAEYKIGALQNTANSAMLTLGTGVGCGIILNNAIYYGKMGASGEIDFPVHGIAMAKIAEKYDFKQTDCFKIYESAKNNDIQALKVYNEWQMNLVDAIVIINQLLDIECVALSGSLAKIADYEYIQKSVNTKTWRNPLCVKQAKCGTNAGLIGAALLCADKINGGKL